MNLVKDISDVLVIIRTVGERTEKACYKLIRQQGVREENIVIIREVPFSASLFKSYEAGIKKGLKWTLCVDADVLLRTDSISTAIDIMEGQSSNVFELQGYMLDKFFGGPREAGFHLYRTALLEKGLEFIPKENNIRPETKTLSKMHELGFPFLRVPLLFGLHDFEQYYSDIFRKCFVQAHKHLYRSELLISVLRDGMDTDPDLKVGLDGFVAGLYHPGEVAIDADQQNYSAEFQKLNLNEKPELSANEVDYCWVERIIKKWKEPEIFRKYLKFSARDLELLKQISFSSKLSVLTIAGVMNFESINRSLNATNNTVSDPTDEEFKRTHSGKTNRLVTFMKNVKRKLSHILRRF